MTIPTRRHLLGAFFQERDSKAYRMRTYWYNRRNKMRYRQITVTGGQNKLASHSGMLSVPGWCKHPCWKRAEEHPRRCIAERLQCITWISWTVRSCRCIKIHYCTENLCKRGSTIWWSHLWWRLCAVTLCHGRLQYLLWKTWSRRVTVSPEREITLQLGRGSAVWQWLLHAGARSKCFQLGSSSEKQDSHLRTANALFLPRINMNGITERLGIMIFSCARRLRGMWTRMTRLWVPLPKWWSDSWVGPPKSGSFASNRKELNISK